MDKTLEGILKAFVHLARELQVYFFSGMLILIDLFVIDKLFFSEKLWSLFFDSYKWLVLIIVAYVLGHISMGFLSFLIEGRRIEKFFQKKICRGEEYNCNTKKEPELFIKNKEAYLYFIERDTNMLLMRWSMSGAFLCIAIIHITVAIVFKNGYAVLWAFLSLLASFFLYVLSVMVEKEKADYINALDQIPPPSTPKQTSA